MRYVKLVRRLRNYMGAAFFICALVTSVRIQPMASADPLDPPDAPASMTAVSPTNTAVELSWDAVTNATYYNLYRGGEVIASPTTTSYTDYTAPEGYSKYLVSAVNDNGESDVVTHVYVMVDTAAPSIGYSNSPSSFVGGWNNSNVTVTFSCADTMSGVQSCTSPVTVSSNGAAQTVTGTAADAAGNTATVTSTVNLDKTAPTASGVTMTTAVIVLSANETISATATDALSGVTGGEYYIDTDPGQGNGSPMTYTSGTVSATTTLGSGLSIGTHTLFVRTQDAARNWSTAASTTFIFI